jgi:sortase A
MDGICSAMSFVPATSNIGSFGNASIETTLTPGSGYSTPARAAALRLGHRFGVDRIHGRNLMRILKSAERLLLVVGIALLTFCALSYVSGRAYSHLALSRFHATTTVEAAPSRYKKRSSVDFSLWDETRIREYEASLGEHFDAPLAVLRIEKVHLEVPVFNGTDEMTLNRGVGRIVGSGSIDKGGNVGIAGHRDGFFRALKEVTVNDTLQLETKGGTRTYLVDKIQIVSPEDVGVLKGEPVPALTLVTCYPFYFVGSAPKRYVVHASLKSDSQTVNQSAQADLRRTDLNTKENTK